jgi:succinate dehydrogenase flavin-adding protein (antitoxin of CptAB toxin-antitoxin module)
MPGNYSLMSYAPQGVKGLDDDDDDDESLLLECNRTRITNWTVKLT